MAVMVWVLLTCSLEIAPTCRDLILGDKPANTLDVHFFILWNWVNYFSVPHYLQYISNFLILMIC